MNVEQGNSLIEWRIDDLEQLDHDVAQGCLAIVISVGDLLH